MLFPPSWSKFLAYKALIPIAGIAVILMAALFAWGIS